MRLILNNLSSPVDTQCLAAGKLAMHLRGHLRPTDVGAEGDWGWEVLMELTGRRARIAPCV